MRAGAGRQVQADRRALQVVGEASISTIVLWENTPSTYKEMRNLLNPTDLTLS